MHQVELNDRLYEEVQRRARMAGFRSVDAYVAEVLQQDITAPENFQHLFTAERLAHIDRAEADIESGNFRTPSQLDSHIAEIRAACLRESAS
jgi:hypothetical protein